jgi:hypothetical protein
MITFSKENYCGLAHRGQEDVMGIQQQEDHSKPWVLLKSLYTEFLYVAAIYSGAVGSVM